MENIGQIEVLEGIRELLGAIYIQEMRNYDMLSIIADKLGAKAKELSELHEQGQVLAPPPSFIFEDIEQDIKNDTIQMDLFGDNSDS